MATSEFANTNLEVLYSESEIQARVKELGAEITAEYAGKDLVPCSLAGVTASSAARYSRFICSMPHSGYSSARAPTPGAVSKV
jgi:hypothetical protein